jgi:hypothetical protein
MTFNIHESKLILPKTEMALDRNLAAFLFGILVPFVLPSVPIEHLMLDCFLPKLS